MALRPQIGDTVENLYQKILTNQDGLEVREAGDREPDLVRKLLTNQAGQIDAGQWTTT